MKCETRQIPSKFIRLTLSVSKYLLGLFCLVSLAMYLLMGKLTGVNN